MAESNPRDEEAAEEAGPKKAGIPIDKLMGRIKGLMLDTDANGFMWSELSDAPSLAEKPKRDLKGKRFAGLHDEPWKFSLAVEMTLFARSDDVSPGGTWPYEKFQDRIEAQGHFLPDGLSIEDAVTIVEGDLLRMSPATPKKPAWYEANIEIPMHRRRTSGLMGAPSKDQLESADSTLEWLTPTTRDPELEHSVVTFLDIQRAPDVLDSLLATLEGGDSAPIDASEARSEMSAPELAAQTSERRMAVRTASVLARQVASNIESREAMHEWLRDTTERRLDVSSDPQEWNASSSPLVIEAALRAGQVPPTSEDFRRHCEWAAAEYLAALRSSSQSGRSPR